MPDKIKNALNNVVKKIDTIVTERITSSFDGLFTVVLCLFLVLYSFLTTKVDISYPPHPAILLMPFAFGVMLVKMALNIKEYKKVLWGLLLVAAYSVSFLLNRREFGNYGYLVLLGLITAGAIGICYKKLLNIWVFSVGSVIAVTFFAAFIGSAENLVYYVVGWRLQIRSALGVVYPTDCATWVLFFVMVLWVAYRKIPDWLMLILAVITALFSRLYCNSNTSFFCSLLFIMAIIYKVLEECFFEGLKGYSAIKRIINGFILMLFPLLAAFILLLSFLYGRGADIAYKLDNKFHGRIIYSWKAIEEYGIKLFGTNFEMQGAGGSLVHDWGKYNFLDSSYVNILIRYGVVVFVLVMLMWLYVGYRAVKMDNRRLLFVMAVISIHSFEEHHFLEAVYNPLIMMALADFSDPFKDRAVGTVGSPEIEKKGRISSNTLVGWLHRNASILSGMLVIALMTISLPRIFSIMRTVVDLTSDSSGDPNMLISISMIICMLTAFCAFVYGVMKAAGSIFSEKNASAEKIDFVPNESGPFDKSEQNAMIKIIRQKTTGLQGLNRKYPGLLYIAFGCILTFIVLICCEIRINAGKPSQIARVESERDALEHIFAVNTHPVYSDVLPEIYRAEFPEFRESVYSGEDLARYHRATVLMDSSVESNCFFSRGYLFTKISDDTVVYTNDEAVLTELENAGYHITGYYNVSHEVEIDEDGAGITEELFGGKYIFTANMELVSSRGDTSDRIGEIKVDAYEDSNSQGAEALYLPDFTDGKCQKDIVCNIGSASPETKITIECVEGYEVRLISVSYRIVPDVDTHNHYNDKYQVIRSEYYDLEGNRIAWSDGASAIEFEYDDKGNQNVIRYYGIDDKPLIVGGGYAEVHRVYDELRRVIAESYYGVDGNPKALGSRQASDERVLDVRGNVIVQKYYDLDGEPVLLTSGYSEIHREFDDDNRVTREEYYGLDGKPITLRDGYAAMEKGYDEDGNVILTKYYSSDGTPTIVSSGYSEIHRKFDDLGRTTEDSYYGEDGKLMVIKSGYAIIRWEYDSMGRIIKESYYGTDEKPAALNSGYASGTREYDSNGNCVVQRYFAEDGSPVLLDSGYSELHREFNEKKQLIRESYYGIDSKPVTLKSGQAAVEYSYDEYGNRDHESYLDANGRPVAINNGSAYKQLYFDDRKRQYREEYRDIDNKLTMNTSGFSATEKEYDDGDRVIRETRLDVNGEDVMTPSGYSAIENTYDSNGRLAVRRYVDVTGNPSADKNSMIVEVHYSYDDNGRTVREEYFGADGLPAENNSGYAVVENKYDDKGSVISRKYYDTDGKPTALNSGYAEIRYEYDAARQNIAEWYFDSEGSPVTCTGGYYGVKKEYNKKGLVSVQTLVDTEGNPICSTTGYARSETDYDDHGRTAVIRHYDVDGELTRINSGYAEVHREYDKWGRLDKESYYDEEGKPVLNTSHIAAFVREYDNRDLVIHETYYDTAGTVSENSSGVSELRREYNDTNYMVREERNNTQGTMNETSGYTAAIYEYDDHWLNSSITYTDKNNTPVMLGSGYSKIEYGYDELRNRVKEMYADTAGQYVENTSGYAGIIRTYAGRTCVEESFVNAAEKPVNSVAGYCTVKREYDKDRNLIKVTYLDSTGKPAINTDVGYAEVRYEYDEIRNRTGEYYYDTNGNPVAARNGSKLIKSSYDQNREILAQYKR